MKGKVKWSTVYLLSAMLGAMVFVCIYGVHVLNPFYTAWLYLDNDLSQHYLGWEFFRRSDWFFPIGMGDQLSFPAKASVVFTDSIPLFAIPFKLLLTFYDGKFQYFGLFGLISFGLQGFFAARIMKQYVEDRAIVLMGSFLFILSPAVIFKLFHHTTLGAHWIILVAVYLFATHRETYQKNGKSFWLWFMVGALVAAVHLYYIPMVGVFLGAYIVASVLRDKKVHIKFILPGIGFAIGLFGVTYLLGGFSSDAVMQASGLGYFSFNLNGFWNPFGYSKILPEQPLYTDGQYEGFSYLGFGVILLVVIYLITQIVWLVLQRKNISWKKISYETVLYVLVAFGLIILAASNVVSFNDKLLFEWPDIDIIIKYWEAFRSSGRLVWPVCYLLMLLGVWNVYRVSKLGKNWKIVAYVVLAFCMVIQCYDMSGKLVSKQQGFWTKREYQPALQNEVWDAIAEDEKIEHIVWTSHIADNGKMLKLAGFALDQNMTMNDYYFARYVDLNEERQVYLSNINDTCVYIFRPEEIQEMPDYGLHLYETDDLIVGTVNPIEGVAEFEK